MKEMLRDTDSVSLGSSASGDDDTSISDDSDESSGSSSSSTSTASTGRRSPRAHSPAPRTAAFASLSRIKFTLKSVAQMAAYVRDGVIPLPWSRARTWKLIQRMGQHTWRVVVKPKDRWTPTAASVAPAAAAATAAAAPATPTSAATAASATPLAAAEPTLEAVLEVQTPDPSADARSTAARRLVWLEVVPEEDVDAALHALYTDPAQGSLRGAKALYERALQRFVGVKMRFVLRFLRRQETAQAVQPRQGFLVLQPNDAVEVGHWQADLTDVGLPTSTDAKHALVVVDAFSKYAWAAPLASKHANGITAALERMFLAEGPPITLRTDGGSDMANSDVAALCARYGVARKVCAPYNSQCNGGIERLHLTLKSALSRHAHEWLSRNGSVDWAVLLPLILYAYNTSVHATTRFTPFFLQRSRAARPLGSMALEWRDTAAAAGPALYGDSAACDVDEPLTPTTTAAAATAASAAAATTAAAASATTAAAAAPASPPSAASAAAATAEPGPAEGEYNVARVLATQHDPARNETRYWARWQGYGAGDDSWITAAMAGESERQFNAWIRRTHKAYPPVALPGAFAAPRGFAARDVPVSAADKAALLAARAAKEEEGLRGGAAVLPVHSATIAALERALQKAHAAVRKLKA